MKEHLSNPPSIRLDYDLLVFSFCFLFSKLIVCTQKLERTHARSPLEKYLCAKFMGFHKEKNQVKRLLSRWSATVFRHITYMDTKWRCSLSSQPPVISKIKWTYLKNNNIILVMIDGIDYIIFQTEITACVCGYTVFPSLQVTSIRPRLIERFTQVQNSHWSLYAQSIVQFCENKTPLQWCSGKIF